MKVNLENHLLSYSRIILILGAVMVLFFSCGKDDDMPCEPAAEIPEPEQWEEFVGEYLVYDTLGDFSHSMSIEHFFSGINTIGAEVDSLKITNFNNQFNFSFQYRIINVDGILDIGSIDPLVSTLDSRFYFWHNSDDTDTQVQENYLSNDTIHLFFYLDNIQYWTADGVPYFNCECRETAVKQN